MPIRTLRAAIAHSVWPARRHRSNPLPFDIEDLFGGFRGQGGYSGTQTGGRVWPMRGQDVRAEIEIPFLLAADGGKHDLQFQRPGSTNSETVTITIPAGMETGNVIRLNGLGTKAQAADLQAICWLVYEL